MSKKIDVRNLAKELEKRSNEKEFKLEEYLFDKQFSFVSHSATYKSAVTSRRSGKSVSCAADLVHTAINFIEVVCLYITLSRSNAKRIIWPELKRINRKYNLGAEFNESDLKVEFPNGSIIYCSGASDRTEIEKFRGLAIKKCYIDECQSFPSYISDLIDDVLSPALMDYAGTLCLIGTPGPIPAGFFYEASKDNRWKTFHWTFFDNPHIALKSGFSHEELLARELTRRGIGSNDPSIRREWFGEWVLDTDSLVYKYEKETNDYPTLPDSKYTYLLGVDVGFVDADALAVLAWSNSSRVTYLVEELITRKQGLTELADQINELRKKYDIGKIVMDMGGLGKKLGEELIRRYKIAVEPAEKARKNEYIELFNDSLRTKAFMAKAESQFASDSSKLEWDMDKSTPERKIVSNRFHSDICDAVLYAWRASFAFTYEPPVKSIEVGSKEWTDQLEEQAMEHFKALEEMNNDPYKS